MKQAGLRLEQAPPLWVPFLFFLVAPVFLLLAAAALLWSGPGALASRSSAAAIAVTHLYALGFMAMVMIGSMMQILPVLQGSPVPLPRATAAVTFIGVATGALLLPAGLRFNIGALIQTGAVALGVGFAVFVLAILVCLARAPSQNHAVRAMWLAVLSLGVSAALGVILAALFGWSMALPNSAIHALHPAWGLLGWTGLLLTGVGFELLPMLLMTPLYPKPVARLLGPVSFSLLLVWSVLLWHDQGVWSALSEALIAAVAGAYLLFAVITLTLQMRRRRRLPDVTLDFWRLAMGSLTLACLFWGARTAMPASWPQSLDVVIGVLVMFGFAGSVISGMLYKIMPFLVWFHLQAICPPGVLAPNMKKILPDKDQRHQLRAQIATLILLCAAPLSPDLLAPLAALALVATAVLLQRNMLAIIRSYRETANRARLPATSMPG